MCDARATYESLDALREKLQDGISPEIMIAGLRFCRISSGRYNFELAEDSF
jgi:hypothetical protein